MSVPVERNINKNKNKMILNIEKIKKIEMLEVLESQEFIKKTRKFWVNPFLSLREKHDLEAHLLTDIIWEGGGEYKNFCRMDIERFESLLLLAPQSETEWLNIAKEFQDIWDFPHTLGAIDGKHIRIKAPPNSGSDFYNYKGFFSIVLFAAVDAHSKFIFLDVGGNGRASDVVIYQNSNLKKCLDSGKLNIPDAAPLPGQQELTPYFFIGDDIFGLDKHLMKGFGRSNRLTIPEEVLTYRLSRARLTVEMAFGRMASRFRIFHRPIELTLDRCESVVKACAVLHNYLTVVSQSTNATVEEIEVPKLPETITPLPTQEHKRYKFACRIRENLKNYCVADGDVPYQWNKINIHK